jgi:hypothetical protein
MSGKRTKRIVAEDKDGAVEQASEAPEPSDTENAEYKTEEEEEEEEEEDAGGEEEDASGEEEEGGEEEEDILSDVLTQGFENFGLSSVHNFDTTSNPALLALLFKAQELSASKIDKHEKTRISLAKAAKKVGKSRSLNARAVVEKSKTFFHCLDAKIDMVYDNDLSALAISNKLFLKVDKFASSTLGGDYVFPWFSIFISHEGYIMRKTKSYEFQIIGLEEYNAPVAPLSLVPASKGAKQLFLVDSFTENVIVALNFAQEAGMLYYRVCGVSSEQFAQYHGKPAYDELLRIRNFPIALLIRLNADVAMPEATARALAGRVMQQTSDFIVAKGQTPPVPSNATNGIMSSLSDQTGLVQLETMFSLVKNTIKDIIDHEEKKSQAVIDECKIDVELNKNKK